MDVDEVDLERQRLRSLLVRNFGVFKQIVLQGARVSPVAKSPRDLIEDYLTRTYRDRYRPRPASWPQRAEEGSLRPLSHRNLPRSQAPNSKADNE